MGERAGSPTETDVMLEWFLLLLKFAISDTYAYDVPVFEGNGPMTILNFLLSVQDFLLQEE